MGRRSVVVSTVCGDIERPWYEPHQGQWFFDCQIAPLLLCPRRVSRHPCVSSPLDQDVPPHPFPFVLTFSLKLDLGRPTNPLSTMGRPNHSNLTVPYRVVVLNNPRRKEKAGKGPYLRPTFVSPCHDEDRRKNR